MDVVNVAGSGLSTFISIIILLLVTLNLVLVFIYYLEYRRNQKLLGLNKKITDAERLYKRSQESANTLLNQTIAESQIIIERAYREANQIVAQMRKTTQNLDAKTETEMTQLVASGKDRLEKEIDEFSQMFKNSLTELGKTNVDQVKNIQTQIYEQVLSNINELTAKLASEASTLQEEAGAKSQAQLDQLQAQLDQYKQEQIKKINEHLYDILVTAAKKVLGNGVSISVEKETVLKALDDAKRTGMIS